MKNIDIPKFDGNIAPAPRKVGFKIKYNVLNRGLWNTSLRFAFIVFAFVFYISDLNNNLIEKLHFTIESNIVNGTVTNAFHTSTSVHGVPIVGYEFKYTSESGIEALGVSYETVKTLAYKEGDPVVIEVSTMNEFVSRIQDKSYAEFGDLFFFFMFICLLLISFGIYKGIQKGLLLIRLLQNGELTNSLLISRESTGVKINRQRVYRFKFRYIDLNNREYFHEAKTHKYASITDEKFELIMYDYENPENAILLDFLPGKISINKHGEFV